MTVNLKSVKITEHAIKRFAERLEGYEDNILLKPHECRKIKKCIYNLIFKSKVNLENLKYDYFIINNIRFVYENNSIITVHKIRETDIKYKRYYLNLKA